MNKTWVVVADEAIARILEWPQSGDELQSVDEITDAAAHADNADLRRDAYGRRAGSAPQGSQQNSPHALRGAASVTSSAGESETHQEAEIFARRVAQHLTQARHAQRFDELHLVAAPRFLGLLRKALPAEISKLVTEEIDKDFAHLENADISRRLMAEAHAAPSSRA
jgi:protein required for attachment to host cells